MTTAAAPAANAITLRCLKPTCSDVGGEGRAVMVLMPVSLPEGAKLLASWRCPRCKNENTVDLIEIARLK